MYVLHDGLTRSGARDMLCDAPGQGRLCVTNMPGAMYLGNLTFPFLQVTHRRCDHDCLLVPGLGYKTVTRTACRACMFSLLSGKAISGFPMPTRSLMQTATIILKI